jgi:copper chaperone NosL
MTIPAFIISLLVTCCTAQTEPFNYGKDDCYFCKMGVIDARFGAEVVTKKSKVYKFDDMICMIRFLQSGTLKENEIAHKVVINYEKENKFLDVNKSFFWINAELKSPMGSNAAAFFSKQEAEKAKGNKEGEIVSWNEMYKKVK